MKPQVKDELIEYEGSWGEAAKKIIEEKILLKNLKIQRISNINLLKATKNWSEIRDPDAN